jgi:transposase
MRIRLIKLVEEENMSIAEAGRRVGIKQTSACRIYNCYKKNNHIFEKKGARKPRKN